MRTNISKILFVVLFFVFVIVIGCVESIDPVTGGKLTSVDPNAVTDLQSIATTASTVLGILGMWWPILLPIAGYIGGAVRITKKLTPKLMEAQTETKMYHTVASSMVLGVEEFKKEFPNEWVKLESKFDEIQGKVIGAKDRLKIENVIRGLRGLSIKVI